MWREQAAKGGQYNSLPNAGRRYRALFRLPFLIFCSFYDALQYPSGNKRQRTAGGGGRGGGEEKDIGERDTERWRIKFVFTSSSSFRDPSVLFYDVIISRVSIAVAFQTFGYFRSDRNVAFIATSVNDPMSRYRIMDPHCFHVYVIITKVLRIEQEMNSCSYIILNCFKY